MGAPTSVSLSLASMSAYTVHTAWIGWITVLLWENHLQFHLCAHIALQPRCAAQQVGARPLQRGGEWPAERLGASSHCELQLRTQENYDLLQHDQLV